MEARKHRLYVVKWRDAHGIKHESNVEETLKAHRPAIYWSAGILVCSDAVGVTITQDMGIPLAADEELTYRTRTFIPRELVEEEFDAGLVIRRNVCRRTRADATKVLNGGVESTPTVPTESSLKL